ncbi:MAG: adenosylhomocysteinase [Methylococcales bacterium]|nr:adenosylhomocysteinase [Methylococcales bacterium]
MLINMLAEGRLVNLAAAEGHPASVMDMSFANQASSIAYLWHDADLENEVHPVPTDNIDQQVATMKLAAMDISIDVLTPEQQVYLSSWQERT